MKKLLFLFLFFIPCVGFSQTFYVDGKDDKSVNQVTEKIKFEGFKVTTDSAHADYVVQLLLDGHYKFVSMKQPYKGFIRILKYKTGDEVGRTKVVKGGPTAFNGYNASYGIFSKITDRYLRDELLKCINKQI